MATTAATTANDRSLQSLSMSYAAYKTLKSIGSNPQESDGNIAGGDTDTVVSSPLSWVGILCLTGLLAAMLSFYIVPVYLVDLASLTLILIAPLAAWQKHLLRKLGGMRGQLNDLRNSTNRLTVENRELHVSVNRLTNAAEE